MMKRKFEPPTPARLIRVSNPDKKRAATRRKIDAIQEQKDMDAEMDLLDVSGDKNSTGKKEEN